MVKKFFVFLLIIVIIFLESCGSIFKYKYIRQPVTNKLDWGIVALDGIGVVLFIIPGIVAFTIDYMTGTLFLPEGTITLNNLNEEDIQKVLTQYNINVTLLQLKDAKKIAFNL